MSNKSRPITGEKWPERGLNGKRRVTASLRRKLLLRHFLSPGDVVMLTAAVRDLHACYPDQFFTDIRVPCPEIWENNPYITPLCEDDEDVEQVDCEYPLIHRSNQEPYHFIHGFIQELNRKLCLNIRPTVFKGDLHLSDLEKSWISQVQELTQIDVPFWIVVAGGKYDYTIKWWEAKRYQEVIDHFRDKILFVQVGEMLHHHPSLRDVIDFRGKTGLRQLIRLVYHAQGVLCPVTLLMHLAAAVETKSGKSSTRPCVVVAGGREPSHWEAYTDHQFIHTNGMLSCCQSGGCWKSRTVPLGDGNEKDLPAHLCVDVLNELPRCMDMITSNDVIRRIESYFTGGVVKFLGSAEVQAARMAIASKSTNAIN